MCSVTKAMSSLLAQRLLRISPSVGRPSKLHLKNCKSQHKMSCIPPRCFNVCVLQAPKEEGGKPVSDQLLPPFVITDEQGKPLGAVQVRLGPPPSPPPLVCKTGLAVLLRFPLCISPLCHAWCFHVTKMHLAVAGTISNGWEQLAVAAKGGECSAWMMLY